MTAPVWTVHTDVFEGPMDLLLYLVQRDGVDLANLPMAAIADSYLAWLERLRELNLAVAADYLVMASTLVHLKSLELLPRPPAILEDQEDPREAFARRLVEYQRYKRAAAQLEARPLVGRDVFVREPVALDEGPRDLATSVDAFGLLDLFHELLGRLEAEEPVHRIATAGLDIEDACRHLIHVLHGGRGRGELGAILAGLASRLERVLTFLAALEMARMGWLGLAQSLHLGPVEVRLLSPGRLDFSLVAERIGVETT